MIRSLATISVISALSMWPSCGFAQQLANGSVLKHSGAPGEFIVLRDGVVYWLSEGDELFDDDVVRSQNAELATIVFNGCVMTVPEKKDIELDDDFCALVDAGELSMAELANSGSGETLAEVAVTTSPANAPLVVGGVILSAGGVAAATNSGSDGTGSAASAAAGATQGNVDP